MLISFQGFGHGDSTDFKDLDGFFQQDWISVFSLLRQLPELILDFKLMVFSKELVFWFLSKDWIWFGFSRIGVSFGLSKDRFLNRLLDGLILLSKGLSGLVVNFGRIKVR